MLKRPVSVVLTFGLLVSACRAEPVVDPTLAERRQEARRAEREAKGAVEATEVEVTAAQSRYEAVAAQLAEIEAAETGKLSAFQRAADEVKKYEDTVARAKVLGKGCQSGRAPEEGAGDPVAVYLYLKDFQSEPERDAAMIGLESCRKAKLKVRQRQIRETIADLRAEFAEGIEDAFDENNPYSRGSLKATVRGDALQVTMRGNFEGRKRHSQEQVDMWCEQTPLFTSITLRNSHGTFACRSEGTLKAITESVLTKEGLDAPWIPPAGGDKATPMVPAAPPPEEGPEKRRLTTQLDEARSSLEAIQAKAELKKGDLVKVQSRVRRVDQEESEWRRKRRAEAETSAKHTQTAGYFVGGAGVLSVSIGGYLVYSRMDTLERIEDAKRLQAIGGTANVEELEAKVERQTLGLAVGLGAGIPLLVVGAVLFVVGKRRRADAAKLAGSPGGILVRF